VTNAQGFAGRRELPMLALGFSAGLPVVLVFDVLALWLRESGVSLETIALFSLVGLAYSLKFLWAPSLDRADIPLLSIRLGRRRAWMLACQIPIVLSLWIMSTTDPARDVATLAALASLVAVFSATQDIAIDAWRIEAASGEPVAQGMLAAAYQWGYRIAALIGGTVPLLLAGPFGWNAAYASMAALMAIGIMATIIAPRESRPESDRPVRVTALAAFQAPLRDFFQRHGSTAGLALALVCTYRLPDLVRSIMGPFYLDLGFTLVEVAEIRRVLGMVLTLVGVAVGGFAVARFGVKRAMVAGAVFATASSIGFAWLATQGREVTAMVLTTGLEQAAAGFAGTCLIAYMSSLTSPTFAAGQYALLSSIFTLLGRLLASQSGLIVETAADAARADGLLSPFRALFTNLPGGTYAAAMDPAALGTGYLVFFVYSSILGGVAIVLALFAEDTTKARNPPATSPENESALEAAVR